MKQTNSAIKYLMAQYRAIFKHAYLKGLVSALVLTAGLAAGTTANAAGSLTTTSVTTTDVLFGSDKLGTTTAEPYDGLSDDTIVSGNGIETWDADLILKEATDASGSLTIKSSGTSADSLNITGDGTLTLDKDSGAGEFKLISEGGATANLTLESITVNSGTITLSGTSGGVNVTSNVTMKNGELNLVNTDGAVTLGGDNLTINGGALSLTVTSGNVSVLSSTITLTDGTVTVSGNATENGIATFGDSGSIINLDGGAINLAGGSGTATTIVQGKLTNTADKADGGTILFSGSGGTLQAYTDALGAKITIDVGKTASGTGVINLSSNASGNRTLTIASGGALKATLGKITISGSTTDTTSVFLDKEASLSTEAGTANNTGIVLANNAILGVYASHINSENAAKLKGILDIGSGATLSILDTDAPVTLNDIQFSGNTTQAGYISALANGTITGKDFVVDGTKTAISNKVDNDFTFKSETLTIKSGSDTSTSGTFAVASKLVFDGKGTVSKVKAELGASGARTVNDSDSFNKLGDNATGDALTQLQIQALLSEQGTIEGDQAVVSGGASKGLTIVNGTWTAATDITVSGTDTVLAVGGSGSKGLLDTDLTAAKLDISGKTFNLNGGTLSVGNANNNNLLSAELDLTTAKEVKQNGSTITIAKKGDIKATAAQVQNLLNVANKDSVTGSEITVGTSGTLSVTGDLELSTDNFDATVAAGVVAVSGTMVIDGDLSLTNEGDDVSFAFGGGEIVANSLELNSNDVTLEAGGTLSLNEGISSNANGTTVTVSNTLNLGNLENLEGVSSLPSNSVDVDLEVDAGEVNFNAGNWSALNITNAGTITVGQSTADYFDASGNALTASLTGTKLNASGGSFNVTEYGSARFTEVTAAAEAISLDGGSMTIDGKITKDDVDQITGYGINLASGSIEIGKNAHLTFGANASSAISIVPADTTDETPSSIKVANNTFASGSLSLSGGVVSFTFDNMTFDEDALASLRETIFGISDGYVDGRIDIGSAQIAGIDENIKDNKISWDVLDGYADALVDYQSNNLKQAVVTGVTSSSEIRGNFAALQTDESITANQYIQLTNNTSLQGAQFNNNNFAANSKGELVGLDVAKKLELIGSGNAGKVRMAQDATFKASSGDISVQEINGRSGSIFEAYASNTIISGNAKAGKFVTDASSTFTVAGDLTTLDPVKANSAEEYSRFESTVDVKGNATFNNDVEFENKTNVDGTLTTNTWAGFYGDTTAGAAVFNANAEIGSDALFKAATVTLARDGSSKLRVGEDAYIENGTWNSGSTGYLEADVLTANGGMIVVDPEYTLNTSIAAIGKFGDTAPSTSNFESNGGYANADMILGKNSAMVIGKDASVAAMKDFISRYQVDGHLTEDGVGAVMALNSKIVLANGKRIILDPKRSSLEILGYEDLDGKTHTGAIDQANSPYSATYQSGTTAIAMDADLYLGSGSILALNDAIVAEGNAIEFENGNAAILGEKGSKIVLVGDAFLDSRDVQLFKDQGITNRATGATDNTGVKILGKKGENNIIVESLNGLMFFILEAGTETQGGTLKFDSSKASSSFTQASQPLRETLLAYASRTANYNEYYSDTTNTVKQVDFIDDVADKSLVTYTYDEAKDTYSITLTDIGIKAGLTTKDFVGVDGVLYNRGHNDYLERVTRDSVSGIEGDQAARLSAFGGAAQAALSAGTTTYDAISGRMGFGAQAGNITFADNGQGAGLWVTPVYKSQDSDGFDAQGINYGVDMSLYGLALGGDYTLGNGLRVGAMFNVGSGDADGQGAGAGVSNDFDYYGIGLYAGYTMDKFSVVADISYTAVDNTLEVSNFADKLSASTDTASLSVGVTGQYALDFNGMSIVPHAGLRYTNIDMDDYTVKGANYGDVAHYGADSFSVFSIPVGVTFAKEITSGAWTVKPAFDLTLAANVGDDSAEGSIAWDGISNLGTKVESEVVDSFTYGATLGVAAKTGNFSLGFGVNYTGSSNVDEYGVNANARFVF